MFLLLCFCLQIYLSANKLLTFGLLWLITNHSLQILAIFGNDTVLRNKNILILSQAKDVEEEDTVFKGEAVQRQKKVFLSINIDQLFLEMCFKDCLGLPRNLLRHLWSQNYFKHNTKMSSAYFTPILLQLHRGVFWRLHDVWCYQRLSAEADWEPSCPLLSQMLKRFIKM